MARTEVAYRRDGAMRVLDLDRKDPLNPDNLCQVQYRTDASRYTSRRDLEFPRWRVYTTRTSRALAIKQMTSEAALNNIPMRRRARS